MNRPIKFRGKPIEMVLPNGKYLLGDFVFGNLLIHKNGTHRILVPIEDGFENFAIAPSTLGQFTGLYDKNGKEIYEGDTIEVISRNRVQTVRVEWDNTMYGFCAYNVDKSANRPLGWFTQNATSIRIVAVPATLPNLSKKIE